MLSVMTYLSATCEVLNPDMETVSENLHPFHHLSHTTEIQNVFARRGNKSLFAEYDNDGNYIKEDPKVMASDDKSEKGYKN